MRRHERLNLGFGYFFSAKMDFCSMNRKELQSLCKKNGIPANVSNVEMATRLAAIQKVKQQKMFKSCLKNLEIVVNSDDENDRVKSKGGKRVKFSPENETFEFEKTDPRELRLLARKRRALVKSELGKNPVLVSENLSNVEDSVGNLVAECGEFSGVEKAVGRNLRRKSMVKSNAVVVSIANAAKHVEKENPGRNLRCRSRKAELKDVETALLSPCGEKKATKGRKGDEIGGRVVDVVDRPPVETADHTGDCHMVTRRTLRSRGKKAENLVKSAAAAAGFLGRSKLIKKDLNEKGENTVQVLRRSVRHAEKARGGDLTSVSKVQMDDKSSNDDAAKNNIDNRLETTLDNRKRKRVGKKAASGNHQPFEKVFNGYADQRNGNVEKPVDDNAVVGKRLQSREVVIEDIGKGYVGKGRVLQDESLTRKSIRRRAKNDENGQSSIPARAARRSTRQTGKVKADASLSVQVADDVPQSADDMSRSDNQKAQLVNEASEARDSIMEEVDSVMDDGSFSEQTIPDGGSQDHSVEEKMSKKVEGQYHTTLGSASTEPEKEKFVGDIQVCTNSPKQLCVAYDSGRPEDCVGSNDSNEKAPANVGADAYSTARSEGPVPPLLHESSDCEAKCSVQVNNSLDVPLKLHIAAVDDFQGGIIPTPASISTRKFSVSLAAENFADVSEPVFHSTAKPATTGESKIFNADCELSSSGTELRDRKMGSKKVTSNKRDRLFNCSRNEKLSKQINGLEESPVANEENQSENAIKNQMLDHAAAVVHNIDDRVIDQGEAAGSRERCESVSRKTECATPEVFGSQGLNLFVSQEKGLVSAEANSGASAQHIITVDRSTLSTEALLATICELTEEDEDTKTVTPVHNRLAGTTSRSTEEPKMEESENTDGCEDMSESSIVGNNLYLQSQVEGDFTAALGLPKKREESYKETLGDLPCLQNRSKQVYLVKNDEFITAKQLEAADGFGHHKWLSIVFKDNATKPGENQKLESEKAAVVSNSNKDVDSAINELSECISAVSGITKYLELSSGKVVEGHEADTSPCGNESTNPVQGQHREPLQGNWASYSGNLISCSDVKSTTSEVSKWSEVTKKVILADMPEISVRHDDNSADLKSRASTVPSGIMEEEVHKISQVQDKSSLIETEETSQSLKILHDSFTAQERCELECTVDNVDVSPYKSAVVNETVSKLFTDDMHYASENTGERKLVEAASISTISCEGLCSIPSSVLNRETDYEGVKINCDMDQAEAKDIVCPTALELQSLVGNEKATNEPEEPMQDASEVRCLPLRDDCVGINNVNLASKESKHGEVNNSEDACITKGDRIGHESPGNLQKSPCAFTEVSDGLIDSGMCNSEEVEFGKDQGNTKRGRQSVNGELLGSHIQNANEAAFPIENDHLAYERPEDLQRSTYGLDGMHFALCQVEHEENGSPACDADIEELRTGEFMPLEGHDDKGNVLDYMGEKLGTSPCKLTSADEETLEASKNAMHDTNIREIGFHVICSSPSSLINEETHVHVKGDFNADKAEDPQSFGRNEKPIDEIDGALSGASEIGCAPLLDYSLGASKDNVALKESELGEVKFSENACMTRSDDSASERQNDLCSSSCGMADVSDVVIDHGKMNTSEEVEVDAEIDYEHLKGNCDADEAVTHDVFYPASVEAQSFGRKEKAIEQTERASHDASDDVCALLSDGSHGTGKGNAGPKESELCEVRNSEDACMTRSDHLPSERRKELRSSSCGMTEVSDVVIDHEKMDNSEEVHANRDQGNSRTGQQTMNGGQLDVLLQEKTSATATNHLAFKVSEDSRSSCCGHDGICSVQHSDYKENGCLAKIEEQQLCESGAVIDHDDAEGVGVNSTIVDEKTLQVLMNSIHGTTENFSEKELVEAATIREASTEGAHCDVDQAGTKDILYRAMVELEPQFSGGYEKITEKIEETSEDTSAVKSSPLTDDSAGTSELNVVLKESEHGELNSLEDACLIGSDDLASEKPEDIRSAPCEIAEVSDVIENGKSNSSEVVSGADQALNSNGELEPDQHMLLKDDKREEGYNVASVEREVEILPPESVLIKSKNSEAVTDMHDNPGSSSAHKLFDVTEVNEMAHKAVSNYPCSMANHETSYGSFKVNSELALEKLEEDSTCVGMHDHSFLKMPENGEVLFNDLEDTCLNMVDHSVVENYSVVKSKEGEHAKVNPVEFDEMCLVAVEHFSSPCEMGTESILGGSDNNDDNSSKAGTFSPSPCAFDNVIDHLQQQNPSPSMSGSQQPQSAESVSAAHAGATALNECNDQECSVESCLFSSWEIDLIWEDMTEYNYWDSMQQPVNEHIVSGKELADDGHLSSAHCKIEDIEGRNGVEHKVADEHTVNQEIQLAEEQLNRSRENPDCTSGNMNETSRADKHPNCPHNAKSSDEFPQNAKDFHTIDHADSNVAKPSTVKRKNSRSILIHGTPQKPPLFIHDMKENTQAPKARQMIDVTAVKPMLKRKALEDLRK